MSKTLKAVGVLAAGIVLLVGAIFVVSELSGEVVQLRTRDAAGELATVRVWVVEDGGAVWLRAGDPSSAWLARLRAQPEVELVRGERVEAYQAVPVENEEARVHINDLMARDYGLGERVIALIHDETQVVPIRLEPQVAAGPGLE